MSKNIWIHEIGALLAMALGYGLTTTRELALASGGRWEEEQFSEQTFRTMQDRLPGRRVVSHNGLRSSPEAALHLLPKPHRDVLPIWVRERDEYLDHLAQRSPRVAHRVRGQLRLLDVALARSNPEPVLVVDMTPSFDRDEQWAEVFRVVAVIMEHLRTAQAIANAPVPPVVRAPLEADRDVGAVLLAYLTHQWQQSGSGLF